VLYSINVFITFAFSQMGIIRYWWNAEGEPARRLRSIVVGGAGLLVTLAILVSLVILKFRTGGWITLTITAGLTVVVMLIRKEYRATAASLKRLDDLVEAVELSIGASNDQRRLDGRPRANLQDRIEQPFCWSMATAGWAALAPGDPALVWESFSRFVFVMVGVIDAAASKARRRSRN